jgi:hypothetical protein
VGLKDRIRRLEKRALGGPDPPCPECNGQIIVEEIDENGASTFPERGPCASCGSRGTDGWIGRIVVDRRNPEGQDIVTVEPAEDPDGFTFELDKPGRG